MYLQVRMHTRACTYLSAATNFPVHLLFPGPPWRMKPRDEARPLGNSPSHPVKVTDKKISVPAGDRSSKCSSSAWLH